MEGKIPKSLSGQEVIFTTKAPQGALQTPSRERAFA